MTEEKVKRSTIKKVKRAIKNTVENKRDQVKGMVDAKYIERWMRICDGPVDYDNPYVKVERTLTDIRVQKILTNKRWTKEERHDRVKEYFPDEESFNLYLTGIQPLDPDKTPYTWIEDQSLMKMATVDAVKEKFKKKKK